jgi:hypothetical protein
MPHWDTCWEGGHLLSLLSTHPVLFTFFFVSTRGLAVCGLRVVVGDIDKASIPSLIDSDPGSAIAAKGRRANAALPARRRMKREYHYAGARMPKAGRILGYEIQYLLISPKRFPLPKPRYIPRPLSNFLSPLPLPLPVPPPVPPPLPTHRAHIYIYIHSTLRSLFQHSPFS